VELDASMPGKTAPYLRYYQRNPHAPTGHHQA
jgi:hypothetical protein